MTHTSPTYTEETHRDTVLMISKPIIPPWNDSSKNLVKDLVQAGSQFRYQVLTTHDTQISLGAHVQSIPLYRQEGRYTPALLQNLKVMNHLLLKKPVAITHFFFAPNPKTSTVARACFAMRPRITVQTVCSTPKAFHRAKHFLFADKSIVLSRYTYQRFVEAGVSENRLTIIPPGICPPTPLSSDERYKIRERYLLPQDRPLVLYAGDYQFSDAAQTVADAIVRYRDPDAHFIFACRIKQPASREIERQIQEHLFREGVRNRVSFFNEIDDMIAFLGACDLCVLPAESLYAKMDLPLVLLEAMALELPIVVADTPPISELCPKEVGICVPPRDGEHLAHAIKTLVEHPELRRTMGQAGRNEVLTRYDIHKISHRYEALYTELLNERMNEKR